MTFLNLVKAPKFVFCLSTTALLGFAVSAQADTVCRRVWSVDGSTREICEHVSNSTRNIDGSTRGEDPLDSVTRTPDSPDHVYCPAIKRFTVESVSKSGKTFNLTVTGKAIFANISRSADCYYQPTKVILPEGFEHVASTPTGADPYSPTDNFTVSADKLSLNTQYRIPSTGETGFIVGLILPNTFFTGLRFGPGKSQNDFIYQTRTEEYAPTLTDVQESTKKVLVRTGI